MQLHDVKVEEAFLEPTQPSLMHNWKLKCAEPATQPACSDPGLLALILPTIHLPGSMLTYVLHVWQPLCAPSGCTEDAVHAHSEALRLCS